MIICGQCGASLPIAGKFCAECGARLETGAQPGAGLRGFERRHVHVMFVDLVDSTELAARLDPEELMELIAGYQAAVTGAVARYGGHVSRYVGDGILAYFGWPVAHEDAAERALHGSREVVRVVAALQAPADRLAVRVGIASGDVVAGFALSGDTILGEAPNIAARLQGLAGPNEIVIDAATKGSAGGLFDLDPLGAQMLKGYARPIEAWRVGAERAQSARFETSRDAVASPLIGREEEIGTLLRRWEQACAGEGRVVLVSGEAGIGKSRLLSELKDAVRDDDHRRIDLYASAHHRDATLHPVARMLERMAGLTAGDDNVDRFEKLVARLAPGGASRQDAAVLAHMLSIADPEPDDEVAMQESPQRAKERAFAILLRLFAHVCAAHPVLLLVEDAHWLDHSTLDFLDRLVERAPRMRLLIVQSFRTGYSSPWIGKPGVTNLVLNRFGRRQAASLVAAVCPGLSSPVYSSTGLARNGMIERIVDRSDGVPLFVVEIARAAWEAANDGGVALAAVPVPATLTASLLNRLDRLPEGKPVAQACAVLGREFSRPLLDAVMDTDAPTLERGLDQLLRAGIIIRRGLPEERAYLFRHSLVQEAVYGSLLRSRQRLLHARTVAALPKLDPNASRSQAGLLGHHCAQAGLIEQAAQYYRRAGENSAARAALAETRAQLERGMELLGTLPEGRTRQALEVELELAFGRVLLSIEGNAAPEAGRLFRGALEKCRILGAEEPAIRALWGLWFNEAHRLSFDNADALAREMLALADARQSEPARAAGQAMTGIVRLWQGRFLEARTALEASHALCERGGHAELDVAIVGDNLADHVAMQLSLTFTCLGRPDRAAALVEPAAKRARLRGSVPARAIVLAIRCRHASFTRNDASLLDAATELADISDEQGYPFYLALARCHLGWLAAKAGRVAEGFDLLRRGLDGLRDTGAVLWEPFFASMLAEAHAWAGQADAALKLIDGALALAEESGAPWFSAELHRLRGEALLGSPDRRGEAEADFRAAIGIARAQCARLWELRAATSLAGLLIAGSRASEAMALLDVVCAWNEGGDFADLRAAHDLRARLHAASEAL